MEDKVRTDSLLARKLKNLRTQPPTIRGRMIDWYCSLADRPVSRMALFAGVTFFVFLHLISFTYMLRHDVSVSLVILTLLLDPNTHDALHQIPLGHLPSRTALNLHDNSCSNHHLYYRLRS